MAKFDVRFYPEKCKGCELCKSFCPKKLIEMSGTTNSKGYFTAYIKDENKDQCIGCISCATMCPDGAIEIFSEEA